MPRGGEKDSERDKGKGDHAGNVTSDINEKSDDRKKPRKFNQYGNRNRNYGYYGKSRYRGGGGGERHYYKRAKFDVGEKLKDVDLGITEYVGDTEGFTGTIKERYADFVVHEITTNGEIAKLTDKTVPPDPDVEDIEDLKKKIPEEIWEQLQSITEDNPGLEIDVTTMDRSQRKCIHQIVKKLTSVISETIDVGDRKVMVFSKEYTNKFGTKDRDNRKDWSNRGGDYCHFILHKVNLDTMDALNQISKVLEVKSSIFNYSGTKDRRAVTTQWISVKKMNPRNIKNAAHAVWGTYVGNFKFEKEPLKLGKLDGNRFTIALRNVSAPDDLIEKAMISFRDNGFINYYGLQRFGTIAAIPTYEIGKALLQGNWEEAIDLILKPRDGEQDTKLAEARVIYRDTKDSRLAYKKIRRADKIEAKLLMGLNVCGQKNLQGALDMVPRNTILMYIHAYQSIVWNKIVSRRIKEYGLKPIVGDLVYVNPESKDDIETVNDDTHHETEEAGKSTSDEKATVDVKEPKTDESNSKSEDSEKAKEKSEEQQNGIQEKKESSRTEDEKSSEKDDNDLQLPPVKILTEEDLPNYTIADIVMPQPGWRVTYPPYAKAWYDEYLEKDGLTTDLKQKNKKYTLGGSYRKILTIPQDLSWSIARYANKTDDLIASDMDEMKGITKPLKKTPDGAFKALIIKMSLKSCVYATMALREILKCDTSSQTHAAQSAAFHAAHEKSEASKKNEQGKSAECSETDENIPNVENLKLKDHSSEDISQSTEDEANDKTITSSVLEDSIMEEDAKMSAKINGKPNSNMLDDSILEEKSKINDSSKSAHQNKSQKHDVDVINDSGIEAGSTMNV